MGIGYARVDSVNMLINGDISSNIIKDVFITNATIQNNPNNNYINTYAQTTINTDIELSNSDLNSMVTLEITILNNANKEKIFNEIIYSSSLYSNNNISFLLTGIKNGDISNYEFYSWLKNKYFGIKVNSKFIYVYPLYKDNFNIKIGDKIVKVINSNNNERYVEIKGVKFYNYSLIPINQILNNDIITLVL